MTTTVTTPTVPATKAQYNLLRARWIVAYEEKRAFSDSLQKKYHTEYTGARMTKAEGRKLASLEAREDKADKAFHAWLVIFSPRAWFYAPIPWYWINTELTYEDAITSGPLSVTPPPSWGHYPSDVDAFAARVLA